MSQSVFKRLAKRFAEYEANVDLNNLEEQAIQDLIKLVEFIQKNYPDSLPKLRASFQQLPEKQVNP